MKKFFALLNILLIGSSLAAENPLPNWKDTPEKEYPKLAFKPPQIPPQVNGLDDLEKVYQGFNWETDWIKSIGEIYTAEFKSNDKDGLDRIKMYSKAYSEINKALSKGILHHPTLLDISASAPELLHLVKIARLIELRTFYLVRAKKYQQAQLSPIPNQRQRS